jgi:hypothetical protein
MKGYSWIISKKPFLFADNHPGRAESAGDTGGDRIRHA